MGFDARARAESAKAASRRLANAPTEIKNKVLKDIAARIEAQASSIISANKRDLVSAQANGLAEPLLRRLALTEKGVGQLVDGVRQVAELPDPVGQEVRSYTVPSGLNVKKVRCPLGVILMIYESRPGVTVDAFSLCFKSGNACILKGGREALHSNLILAENVRAVLEANDMPADAMTLVDTSDREVLSTLLHLDQFIDLAIPRGGHQLVAFVHEHAKMPTVQHFHGVCHIYVDKSADIDKAVEVCATAKLSAPATCNAAECFLVHEAIASEFLLKLEQRLSGTGVEVRGDEKTCSLMSTATPASVDDWGREFLDLIVAVRVVSGLDTAVDHIGKYGSNHSDAIMAEDLAVQRQFIDRVYSSCVLVNASTRFNDGYQLGLGAEIGISTSRIHAYGPMGLEELTTQRYVVTGNGQFR